MERKVFWRDAVIQLLIVIALVVGDQLVKVWARNTLAKAPIILWKNVFSLRLVYNTGAAFGIFHNHTLFLTIYSFALLAGILVFYFWLPREKKMRPMRYLLAFVVGGSIGNIIDRAAAGKVTDMFSFDLINFPVFNIADIALTCSCFVMVFLCLFYYKDEDYKKWKKSNS